MIYDAFAHLPLYGLGDLSFMPHEETGKFIADGDSRTVIRSPQVAEIYMGIAADA